MTDCSAQKFRFAPLGRRVVEAAFEGGDISSDGGVLLLRELDRRLGLVDQVAAVLSDPRDPDKIEHTVADLIRQRVFALCPPVAEASKELQEKTRAKWKDLL